MRKVIEGECDCCGEYRLLRQAWAPGGLEAWACAVCRGDEPEAYDEPPEYEHEDKLAKNPDSIHYDPGYDDDRRYE